MVAKKTQREGMAALVSAPADYVGKEDRQLFSVERLNNARFHVGKRLSKDRTAGNARARGELGQLIPLAARMHSQRMHEG